MTRIGIYGPGARGVATLLALTDLDAEVLTGADYVDATADAVGDEPPTVVLALGPEADDVLGAARAAAVPVLDLRSPEAEAALWAGLPGVAG